MPRRWPVGRMLAAALLLCFIACGESDTHFSVHAPPGVATAKPVVAVFGVFQDGRMNAESAADFGPSLLASLAKGPCEAGYGQSFVTAKPDLAAAVDAYTRENGVTDELLDHFAPAAKGDLILFVAIAGRIPSTRDGGARPGKTARMRRAQMGGMGRGGRNRGGRAPLGSASEAAVERTVLEVTATLFSIREHRAVGLVRMAYTGASGEIAMKKFSDKLGLELPGASCGSWDWNGSVSEESIRALMGH